MLNYLIQVMVISVMLTSVLWLPIVVSSIYYWIKEHKG